MSTRLAVPTAAAEVTARAPPARTIPVMCDVRSPWTGPMAMSDGRRAFTIWTTRGAVIPVVGGRRHQAGLVAGDDGESCWCYAW